MRTLILSLVLLTPTVAFSQMSDEEYLDLLLEKVEEKIDEQIREEKPYRHWDEILKVCRIYHCNWA